MSVHIVARENDYFPVGKWVRCFDHGCQVIEVESVGNRMKPGKEIGIAIPKPLIMPYLISPGSGNFNRYMYEFRHK